MTQQNEEKALRTRNVWTAVILAALVLIVFVSFIVRTWYMRGG